MKRLVICLATLAMLAAIGQCPALAADLKAGDKAPEFELTASDGKTYKLSEFRDKKVVVIAWFPKAFTGGWTAECKSLRASGEAIRKFNVAYFAASCDPLDGPKGNTAFAKSLGLDYPILSDPTQITARAYGVVTDQRPFPFRWTIYIGTDGEILHIDRQVKAGSHGKDVAMQLKKLGVAAAE